MAENKQQRQAEIAQALIKAYASNSIDEFFGGGGRSQLLSELQEYPQFPGTCFLVAGGAGSGKTTLFNAFANKLSPEQAVCRLTVQAQDSRASLLQELAAALEPPVIEHATLPSVVERCDQLAMEGRFLLVLVDDAHLLSPDSQALLADIHSQAGAQIMLFAEPSSDGNDVYPWGGRIPVRRFGLQPLLGAELSQYLQFRLWASGLDQAEPFSDRELQNIEARSAGLPGEINTEAARIIHQSLEQPIRFALQAFPVGHMALVALLLMLVIGLLVGETGPAERARVEVPVAPLSLQSPERPPPAVPVQKENTAVDAAVPEQASTKQVPVKEAPKSRPEPAPKPEPKPVAKAAPKPEPKPEARKAPPAKAEPARATRGYVIQLLGGRDLPKVEAFQQRYGAELNIRIIETRLQGKPWYVAVTGSYSSRESARKAISGLPLDLRRMNPWPRAESDY